MTLSLSVSSTLTNLEALQKGYGMPVCVRTSIQPDNCKTDGERERAEGGEWWPNVWSDVTGAEAETWFGVIACHHGNQSARILVGERERTRN